MSASNAETVSGKNTVVQWNKIILYFFENWNCWLQNICADFLGFWGSPTIVLERQL